MGILKCTITLLLTTLHVVSFHLSYLCFKFEVHVLLCIGYFRCVVFVVCVKYFIILFLSSNSSVYIETTIHAWHVDRGLGDDHSAAIFYFNLDDASSLLCFFDRCFFSASNFRADAAEIFAQSCMGLF